MQAFFCAAHAGITCRLSLLWGLLRVAKPSIDSPAKLEQIRPTLNRDQRVNNDFSPTEGHSMKNMQPKLNCSNS